jgi:site-specific recombinase XerD
MNTDETFSFNGLSLPDMPPDVASPGAKSLVDLAGDLARHYESLQSSPHTIIRLRQALRLFVAYMAEHHYVSTADAVTLEHVHAFQAHLSQRFTAKGLPWKPASINTVIKAVRPFLDYLHDLGFIPRDLAKHLQYIREPHLLPHSVLTHAQVRQLMRKIDTGTPGGVMDRAAIEMLYSSGIRVGELEGLALTDVDLDLGIARVMGKGRKERFVPIGKTALKWLTSYIRGVRPYLVRNSQTNAIFVNTDGKPLRQDRIRARIHEYAAGLDLAISVTPHTFRRSCTSEMIKGNANLYHVKQLLGHKSFETLNHYAKLDITDLRKTHERCHPREKDG